MKQIITLLLLLAFSTSVQSARLVKIIYFDTPKSISEKVYIYDTSGEKVEVFLKYKKASESFEISEGITKLAFLGEDVDSDDPSPLLGAPNINIPESWDKILLIAFKDPTNKKYGIRVKAINAAPSEFDTGQILFINYTNLSLFGKMGSKKLLVKPRSKFILDMKNLNELSYPFKLDYINKETSSKPVYFIRKTWRNYSKRRQLVFIYHPSGSKSVTYIPYSIDKF